MEVIRLSARTDPDGNLKLDVPVGLSDAEVFVLVGHPPSEADSWFEGVENGWPPGFIERTAGSLADASLEPPPPEKVTLREPFDEIDRSDPKIEDAAEDRGWPPGFFERVVGRWEGELVRGDQGEYEVRDELP